MKRVGILSLFFLLALAAAGEEKEIRDSVTLYFRQGDGSYDPGYKGNGTRLEKALERIALLQRDTFTVVRVKHVSSASPEGSFARNEALNRQRVAAVTDYLHGRVIFPDSLVTVEYRGEGWEQLALLARGSAVPFKGEVLKLLDSIAATGTKDDIAAERNERALRALREGKPWEYLSRHLFHRLRYFEMILQVSVDPDSTGMTFTPPVGEDEKMVSRDSVTSEKTEEPVEELQSLPSRDSLPVFLDPGRSPFSPAIYLKSDIVGLGLLVLNAAVEWQWNKHWSLQLPVYYSGVDYFQRELKFRVFAIYPGARYHFQRVPGLFAGVHAGVAFYNVALHGDWRYQDHDRESPAIGGGVEAGYRCPISRSGKWGIEVMAGAGIYRLHYDKFHNERNGKRVKTIKKTYTGIDRLAVSIYRRFECNNKKGDK